MNTQTPARDMYGFIPGLPIYPSDTVSRALVSSIEQTAEPQRQGILKNVASQMGGRWLVGILIMLLALGNLVILWYSNGALDWMMYWILAGGALFLQFMILGTIWYVRRQERKAPGGLYAPGQISIRSLRRGALAGDDSLAPAIMFPSASQAASQSVAAATSFRVAPPESRLLRWQQILWGIALFMYVAIVVMMALLSIMEQSFSTQSITPWQIFALFLALTITYGLQFVTITQKVRSIPVEVRADGLHWRGNSLPWSEARGWCIFAMNPERIINPRPNIIYALVGEHASLAWITYPPFTRTGEPGQQLAQLVQANVTLPLRDLIPGALRITVDSSRQPFFRRPFLLATNDWSLGETPLPRLPTTILTTVLAALIVLGGILTPGAQQWYFGSQLTQLETAPSHLSDPLTANTLQWTPTSDHAASDFIFTPQGYVYQSTTCCDSSSLMTQPMNNGLVEVTVHQRVNFELNEAGIVFRENADRNTMLVFTITPDGEWQLNLRPKQRGGQEANYRTLRYEGVFGGVTAIHQGLDATNRLAVLMRGSTFTFFVNGQYLGRYQSDDLPQSGQVGVYVEGMNGPVTFSDLLISPT